MNEENQQSWESERVGLVVFLAAVLLHGLLLIKLGRPWPGGPRADANVYLELAMILWRDGSFGTRVAIDYPPLYPLLIAPAFAIASNAARFAFIYFLHALVLGLCSLALVPPLQKQLGARSAWLSIAALQFLGASTFLGHSVQTEPLFAGLIVAATGMVWQAWDRPSFGRWAAVGFICGLAVCTRRTGLVLPVAIGLLWLTDALSAWRGRRPLPWKAGLGMACGLAIGLLPEGLVILFGGGMIDTYGGNPVKGHLKAAVDGVGSLQGVRWGLEIVGRHLAYVVVVTLGAPLAIFAMLVHRTQQAPLPLRRASGFVLLVALGLVAMTSLHILRDHLKALAFWDLYPRYVDPPELALVVMGLLAMLWLRGERTGEVSLGRRLLGPGVAAASVCAAIGLAGPVAKARGAHYPRPELLADWGFSEAVAPWFLLGVGALSMLGWVFLWARKTASLRSLLVGFLVASWLLGGMGLWNRLTTSPSDRRPAVLQLPALERTPEAPLAVVVRKRGFAARNYYLPAFRSDHPVWFVGPRDELSEWVERHQEGFVLVPKSDGPLRFPGELTLAGRSKKWLVYRRASP